MDELSADERPDVESRAAEPTEPEPRFEVSAWPWMKLSQGIGRIKELQSAIDLWFTSRPFDRHGKLSDDGLTYSLTTKLASRPPTEHWSILLGDVMHNLRGALDALAWELCTWDGAEPSHPRQVQFPICAKESDWRAKIAGPLKTIPPVALDRMRLVQPFLYKDHARQGLQVLTELSNQDKHRAPIGCSARTATVDYSGTRIQFEDPSNIPNPPFQVKIKIGEGIEDGLQLVFTSSARMLSVSCPAEAQFYVIVKLDDAQFELSEILDTMVEHVQKCLRLVATGPDRRRGDGWVDLPPGTMTVET